MPTPVDAEALREIVNLRHVHFDVEPELALSGQERLRVGFRVRLWAVHRRQAGALPGCEVCAPLVEDLRRVADAVVPPPGEATVIELEAFRPALYASSVVAGADEVALGIHLRNREGLDRPFDPRGEACLREIRRRLLALGIAERS